MVLGAPRITEQTVVKDRTGKDSRDPTGKDCEAREPWYLRGIDKEALLETPARR